MGELADGVWPVMLTPFQDDGRLDDHGVDALTDWYMGNGVAGLFAVCLSSEMYALTEAERLGLAARAVRRTGGRLPVVAAGTFSGPVAVQAECARRLAETGVAAVVLIVNQLAAAAEADAVWQARVEQFLEQTDGIPLGLYECPLPYHRRMTPELLAWTAATGRFVWMKDTCCDVAMERAKIVACQGTPLRWFNAHAPSLLASLEAGGDGFSGIAANLYPQLFAWLCANHRQRPDESQRLQRFLSVADTVVRHRYPASAKRYLGMLGLPIGTTCRIPVAAPRADDDEGMVFADLRAVVGEWETRLMPHLTSQGERIRCKEASRGSVGRVPSPAAIRRRGFIYVAVNPAACFFLRPGGARLFDERAFMTVPGAAEGVSARRIHLYANGCRRRVVSGLRRRIHAIEHSSPRRGSAHECISRTASTTHLRDSDCVAPGSSLFLSDFGLRGRGEGLRPGEWLVAGKNTAGISQELAGVGCDGLVQSGAAGDAADDAPGVWVTAVGNPGGLLENPAQERGSGFGDRAVMNGVGGLVDARDKTGKGADAAAVGEAVGAGGFREDRGGGQGADAWDGLQKGCPLAEIGLGGEESLEVTVQIDLLAFEEEDLVEVLAGVGSLGRREFRIIGQDPFLGAVAGQGAGAGKVELERDPAQEAAGVAQAAGDVAAQMNEGLQLTQVRGRRESRWQASLVKQPGEEGGVPGVGLGIPVRTERLDGRGVGQQHAPDPRLHEVPKPVVEPDTLDGHLALGAV